MTFPVILWYIAFSTTELTPIGNYAMICPDVPGQYSLLIPSFVPEKAPVRVTISQAANLFGINEKTVRRAIASGELLYIVVRGVYKINFESLLRWSQSRTKLKNKLENEGIGQFVDQWKIKNKLYSPNPETANPVLPKPEKAQKRGRNFKIANKPE